MNCSSTTTWLLDERLCRSERGGKQSKDGFLRPLPFGETPENPFDIDLVIDPMVASGGHDREDAVGHDGTTTVGGRW